MTKLSARYSRGQVADYRATAGAVGHPIFERSARQQPGSPMSWGTFGLAGIAVLLVLVFVVARRGWNPIALVVAASNFRRASGTRPSRGCRCGVQWRRAHCFRAAAHSRSAHQSVTVRDAVRRVPHRAGRNRSAANAPNRANAHRARRGVECWKTACTFRSNFAGRIAACGVTPPVVGPRSGAEPKR